MNEKELSNGVHMIIHSLRLLSNYKPSEAEKKLSKIVIERFKDECTECKEMEEKIKNVPKETKSGILGAITKSISGGN